MNNRKGRNNNTLVKFIVVFLVFLGNHLSSYGQINIDYWMGSGLDNFNEKKYVAAIDDFNMVIRFRPNFDNAYYYRAISKFNLRDYRGAIEDFSEAISKFNLDYYGKAIEPDYMRGINIVRPYFFNNYPYFFLNRGKAKARLYDLKGAWDDYNKAIEVSPGNEDVFIERGVLSIILKNYDNAIADLNRTIRINSKNAEAFLYRAVAKQCKGLHLEAMNDYDRSIQLDPSNPEAFVKRGVNRADIKDFKNAIGDYDRAIRIDSTYSLAYFERAIAKVELFDYKGAMKDYGKVIELDPENDITYYNRAILNDKVGNFKQAIDDYTQVIKINPTNVYTYFNRALSWHKLSNYKKAIEDYTSAIRLYPAFANAYYNRSVARNAIHDYAGASKDYNAAVNLNANFKNLTESGKLDSSGLAKLTEFKADFAAGNMPGEKDEKIELKPFPNFRVNFVPSDSAGNFTPENEKIEEMNKEYRSAFRFVLSDTDERISKDTADRISKRLDSITPSVQNIPGLMARAIMNSILQNYNASLEDYNQMIKLNPSFSLAYFNRANTHFAIVNLLNSLTNYNDVISIDSNPGTSKSQHSKKLSMQNYDQVMADYNQCIRLDPGFSYAYFNLANVQTNSGNFAGAIDNYTKAVTTNPKFAQAYYNRGVTYLYIREKEKGCVDLSKSGELGLQKAYEAITKFCNN